MKIKIILGLLLTLIFSTACTMQNTQPGEHIDSDDMNEMMGGEEEGESTEVNWKDAELKNVNTGENYKISDFSGKPVLLESFAVWCPTCTKQQNEIKKLHELIGDEVISISLDTDPNENEAKLKEHTARNGFDWYYSISPIDVTKQLMDEFGIIFVNAPSAPIVLICPDQTKTRFLESGVKSAEKLQNEISRSC